MGCALLDPVTPQTRNSETYCLAFPGTTTSDESRTVVEQAISSVRAVQEKAFGDWMPEKLVFWVPPDGAPDGRTV